MSKSNNCGECFKYAAHTFYSCSQYQQGFLDQVSLPFEYNVDRRQQMTF